MRRSLLLPALSLAALLLGSSIFAQTDRFAYVVTDNQQQGSNWQYLRKVNLANGQFSEVLLNGTDQSFKAFDATTKKEMAQPMADPRMGNYVNAPFATGVAAIAYDKRNNRLYYTPMLFDQLRYIDLRTMKVYYVNNQIFTGKPVKSSSQGDIITRMTMGADGNGYALTNDGSQLIRFTTGRKMEITDLGSLVDDPANKISIHNSCSSFGGDMIADDRGNLYVFSARNQVFLVNIETRLATHLGTIQGLPQGFTANGAVVNERNQVLVSSAVQNGHWYAVEMKNLTATVFELSGQLYQCADLGNSNVLTTSTQPPAFVESRTILPSDPAAGQVSIYPNPVTSGRFNVEFHTLSPGSYTIQVTDVMGRQVAQQLVSVTGDNQVQAINLADAKAKGVYLVKVLDAASKSVFSTKLIVQ